MTYTRAHSKAVDSLVFEDAHIRNIFTSQLNLKNHLLHSAYCITSNTGFCCMLVNCTKEAVQVWEFVYCCFDCNYHLWPQRSLLPILGKCYIMFLNLLYLQNITSKIFLQTSYQSELKSQNGDFFVLNYTLQFQPYFL